MAGKDGVQRKELWNKGPPDYQGKQQRMAYTGCRREVEVSGEGVRCSVES